MNDYEGNDNFLNEYVEVRINFSYYTDLLGKETTFTLLEEYDEVIKQAKRMEIPESEFDAFLQLVEPMKKMEFRNLPPAKLLMKKNLEKFAKKRKLNFDLFPYFMITIFDKRPDNFFDFMNLVINTAIEFCALMDRVKKKIH